MTLFWLPKAQKIHQLIDALKSVQSDKAIWKIQKFQAQKRRFERSWIGILCAFFVWQKRTCKLTLSVPNEHFELGTFMTNDTTLDCFYMGKAEKYEYVVDVVF